MYKGLPAPMIEPVSNILSLKWNVSPADDRPPRRFWTFTKLTLCSEPALIPVINQSLIPAPLTSVLAPGPPKMRTGAVDESVCSTNVSLLPPKTSTEPTPPRNVIGDLTPLNWMVLGLSNTVRGVSAESLILKWVKPPN